MAVTTSATRRTRLAARPRLLAVVVAVVVAVAAVGLGTWAAVGRPDPDGALTGLRIMAPNNPGGGHDITARTSAKIMEDAGIARTVEVFNLPGASGTVGLGRLVAEDGNGRLAMVMSLGVIGGSYAHSSRVTLADTTPIARLLEEPEIVVVSANSPYTDIGQLIDDWRSDPGKVAVGGGSAPGGPDYLAPMLMAKAIGLDPKKVDYVPFDGGGELAASVIGDKVAFGVSGIGEHIDQVEAGTLRVLAVTGPERIEGVDAPTLREAGVDVEFTNWRGVVAPPGISDADRRALVEAYTEMHGTRQWKAALERNGWRDAFQTGDDFGAFIGQQTDEVESVLEELGLT
ncbi:Bug family tripartite tricarboxylate transporter substrate binding protein [Streptomyces sp. NPDC096132]|uniref:Bug family tripartite tricarboxylate transporter substrate binding protein n=1 Tax=Streptomyces sp. NPDC096132 TaxID=3366075 RepID=UPI003817A846